MNISATSHVRIHEAFTALGSASALKVVRALQSGPLTTSDVSAIAGLERAWTSKRLNELRRAGLLTSSQDGAFVIYELNRANFALLEQYMASVATVSPTKEELEALQAIEDDQQIIRAEPNEKIQAWTGMQSDTKKRFWKRTFGF